MELVLRDRRARRRPLGRLEPGRRDQRPAERSERAIWIDGEPSEPGPVEFDGLEAIVFDDGARLDFEAEAERRRDENKLLMRYSYRQPFGTFSGSLPGGLALESGLGVMEHHDARW